MPSRRVGCKGDSKANGSSLTTHMSRPGAWAATTHVEELYDTIVSGGKNALKKVSASFTFTFSDGASPPSAVLVVTLEPGTTTLTTATASLLLDGDEITSEGNKISVTATGPLSSS